MKEKPLCANCLVRHHPGENTLCPSHRAWEGCGECDSSFLCNEGRQRCIRLESSKWKIWPNCMQAPGGDVLFLADLRKLLATQKLNLVAEVSLPLPTGRQSSEATENEAMKSQLARVRALAMTQPNQFFEGAWRTALLEILDGPLPSKAKSPCK